MSTNKKIGIMPFNDEFTCEYCGEMYHQSIQFKFVADFMDGVHEEYIVCPDCISSIFAEDPEAVKSMKIERVI